LFYGKIRIFRNFLIKEGWKVLLKILQIVFSIIAFSLSVYGLITRDYQLNFLMIFFLGLFMLTLGIKEFQREKSLWLVSNRGIFIFGICVNSRLRIALINEGIISGALTRQQMAKLLKRYHNNKTEAQVLDYF